MKTPESKQLKVLLLCASDTIGGAAVVTFRLMQALRQIGVDARMLVARKGSDSQFVARISKPKFKKAFLSERLGIFFANGFNKSTLFKIDTASAGVDISSHPWVVQADVIALNWVNQGFLSIADIHRLSKLGKPLVWTMHDMWNMTGICHHAGYCTHFENNPPLPPTDSRNSSECRNCPLLRSATLPSLAHRIWKKKQNLYQTAPIHFVAVSNWLADRARASSLLSKAPVSVIPNPFPLTSLPGPARTPASNKKDRKLKLVFGAARIDDPIKGHQTLLRATQILKSKFPEIAANAELTTFGSLKNPDALSGIAISHNHLGPIPSSRIREIYENADAVISTSEWETLPGTLIEGQAWGCIPIALDHGGQRDIIDHLSSGFLHPFSSPESNAEGIADGIAWVATLSDAERQQTRARMQQSVIFRFSESQVALKYLSLFKSLLP